MNLKKAEMETVIRFDESEDTAVIYTCSPVWKRKLQKLVLEHAKIARLKEVDGFGGETYLLPKRLVKLSAPRALSEAQKAVFYLQQKETEKQNKEGNPLLLQEAHAM